MAVLPHDDQNTRYASRTTEVHRDAWGAETSRLGGPTLILKRGCKKLLVVRTVIKPVKARTIVSSESEGETGHDYLARLDSE